MVWIGKKSGVFNSWEGRDGAKEQVKGFKEAKQMSFSNVTKEEALEKLSLGWERCYQDRKAKKDKKQPEMNRRSSIRTAIKESQKEIVIQLNDVVQNEPVHKVAKKFKSLYFVLEDDSLGRLKLQERMLAVGRSLQEKGEILGCRPLSENVWEFRPLCSLFSELENINVLGKNVCLSDVNPCDVPVTNLHIKGALFDTDLNEMKMFLRSLKVDLRSEVRYERVYDQQEKKLTNLYTGGMFVRIVIPENTLPRHVLFNGVRLELFYKEQLKCFRCLQVGHIVRDCPASLPTCFRCKKQGHMSKECVLPATPAWSKPVEVNPVSRDEVVPISRDEVQPISRDKVQLTENSTEDSKQPTHFSVKRKKNSPANEKKKSKGQNEMESTDIDDDQDTSEDEVMDSDESEVEAETSNGNSVSSLNV